MFEPPRFEHRSILEAVAPIRAPVNAPAPQRRLNSIRRMCAVGTLFAYWTSDTPTLVQRSSDTLNSSRTMNEQESASTRSCAFESLPATHQNSLLLRITYFVKEYSDQDHARLKQELVHDILRGSVGESIAAENGGNVLYSVVNRAWEYPWLGTTFDHD